MPASDLLESRSRWIAALMRYSESDLLALGDKLGEQHHAKHIKVPRAGLGMLRLRESVHGDTFNLGEIPLSVAKVELRTASGDVVEGAAYVMADDDKLATALAICDGVLAHDLEGADEVAALVRGGLSRLAERDRERQAMLARSRVDFRLLNQQEESQDEDEDHDG